MAASVNASLMRNQPRSSSSCRASSVAIARFFEQSGSRLFGSVKAIKLFDKEATQAGIRKALASSGTGAGSGGSPSSGTTGGDILKRGQDFLDFGHGIVNMRAKAKLRLLPGEEGPTNAILFIEPHMSFLVVNSTS